MISLGAGLDTPFDISLPTKAAVAAARAAQAPRREAGCFTERCGCAFARDYAGPFPDGIPLTSIYSRGDGVVWWEACIVPYARNVEVTGSHVGLAFNRKAYRAVAEALSAMLAAEAACTRATSARGRRPAWPARPAITTRWISLAPS